MVATQQNILQKIINPIMVTEVGALHYVLWHWLAVFYTGMLYGLTASLMINFFFFMNNSGKRENIFTTSVALILLCIAIIPSSL